MCPCLKLPAAAPPLAWLKSCHLCAIIRRVARVLGSDAVWARCRHSAAALRNSSKRLGMIGGCGIIGGTMKGAARPPNKPRQGLSKAPAVFIATTPNEMSGSTRMPAPCFRSAHPKKKGTIPGCRRNRPQRSALDLRRPSIRTNKAASRESAQWAVVDNFRRALSFWPLAAVNFSWSPQVGAATGQRSASGPAPMIGCDAHHTSNILRSHYCVEGTLSAID
jgi:hypothetical protein